MLNKALLLAQQIIDPQLTILQDATATKSFEIALLYFGDVVYVECFPGVPVRAPIEDLFSIRLPMYTSFTIY